MAYPSYTGMRLLSERVVKRVYSEGPERRAADTVDGVTDPAVFVPLSHLPSVCTPGFESRSLTSD